MGEFGTVTALAYARLGGGRGFDPMVCCVHRCDAAMDSALTKRQQQALKTKAAIVASALHLFQERGFDPVTIADITDSAGVARGSFYTYFKSKSDIIVEEFWKIDKYYEKYAKNLRKHTTAAAKLLAFTRAQLRYVRDVPGIENLKVLYANQTFEPGSDKVINNRQRFWHHLIRRLIAEGQAAGEFRTDIEPETLAVYFNRSMRGVFLDWCISSAEEFDLVKEGVSFCEQWMLSALRRP